MNLPVLPSWASVALKVAPYVAIVVLLGLLIMSHNKVSSLETQVASKSAMFDAAIKSRDFFYQAVHSRDLLIDAQNDSIDAMEKSAAADRAMYLKGITAARSVSADHMKAATELLALKAPDGELAQCRAARDLLEAELVK